MNTLQEVVVAIPYPQKNIAFFASTLAKKVVVSTLTLAQLVHKLFNEFTDQQVFVALKLTMATANYPIEARKSLNLCSCGNKISGWDTRPACVCNLH